MVTVLAKYHNATNWTGYFIGVSGMSPSKSPQLFRIFTHQFHSAIAIGAEFLTLGPG